MQTRTYVGVATAAAAGVAGSAMATDVDFSLEGSNGGDVIEVYFEHSGAIDEIAIDLTFTNGGDFTWAGDITMGLMSPNVDMVEWPAPCSGQLLAQDRTCNILTIASTIWPVCIRRKKRVSLHVGLPFYRRRTEK